MGEEWVLPFCLSRQVGTCIVSTEVWPEYICYKWIPESKARKSYRSETFSIKTPLQVQGIQLSFRTAKDLHNRAEILPSGPRWHSIPMETPVPATNKIDLFYRNPLECLESLMWSPLLKDYISFTPFRLYESTTKVMRTYTEWLSGDAAWCMQVMLTYFSFLLLLLIVYFIGHSSSGSDPDRNYFILRQDQDFCTDWWTSSSSFAHQYGQYIDGFSYQSIQSHFPPRCPSSCSELHSSKHENQGCSWSPCVSFLCRSCYAASQKGCNVGCYDVWSILPLFHAYCFMHCWYTRICSYSMCWRTNFFGHTCLSSPILCSILSLSSTSEIHFTCYSEGGGVCSSLEATGLRKGGSVVSSKWCALAVLVWLAIGQAFNIFNPRASSPLAQAILGSRCQVVYLCSRSSEDQLPVFCTPTTNWLLTFQSRNFLSEAGHRAGALGHSAIYCLHYCWSSFLQFCSCYPRTDRLSLFGTSNCPQ